MAELRVVEGAEFGTFSTSSSKQKKKKKKTKPTFSVLSQLNPHRLLPYVELILTESHCFKKQLGEKKKKIIKEKRTVDFPKELPKLSHIYAHRGKNSAVVMLDPLPSHF